MKFRLTDIDNVFMNQQLLIVIMLVCGSTLAGAHQQQQESRPPADTQPAPQQTRQPAPQQTRQPAPRSTGIDLTDYGVEFAPEPRLIVVMAALEVAGFNPPSAAAVETSQASAFREMLRRDTAAALDRDLLRRLQTFYERTKLAGATTTPAEQAARYVSLAYALGPLPGLEEPPRSVDLPDGVLEVLDFAPLVREFYRKSGIEERLPDYVRQYRAESDRLRRPTGEMVRTLLAYLHTRPETTFFERVQTSSSTADKSKKKETPKRAVLRERARRFIIVPDLLAPPGVINFRVIGDDYFAIVPYGIDPANSDLRRAYLQYVVDPIVARFNRDIAARRADLRLLLDERAATNKDMVTPDVFLAVSRSLVAATEARMAEASRLDTLTRETSVRLQAARDDAARAQIVKESQEKRAGIEDAATAQLADAYERGATLAFYFAEQLRGLESSGFDIRSSFADMIASFDVAKEKGRPAEYAAARARHLARRKAQQELATASVAAAAGSASNTPLIQSLTEVDILLRAKNYTDAEKRLRELARDFRDEPRVHFALGQVTSLSAQDVFDENLQAARLQAALEHYRMTVQISAAATTTTNPDPALVSRAHAAMGRILAFLERPDDALRAFDAAIQIGNVPGGAYNEAVDGRQKLQRP